MTDTMSLLEDSEGNITGSIAPEENPFEFDFGRQPDTEQKAWLLQAELDGDPTVEIPLDDYWVWQ